MLNRQALFGAAEILTEIFEDAGIAKVTLKYLNWIKARGDFITVISKDCYFKPSGYGFEYEVIIAYAKIGDPATGRLY